MSGSTYERAYQYNRIQLSQIMSLRNYKCKIFTLLHWTHPVRQTQGMDLPVTPKSQSVMTLTLWNQWSIWHHRDNLLFDS